MSHLIMACHTLREPSPWQSRNRDTMLQRHSCLHCVYALHVAPCGTLTRPWSRPRMPVFRHADAIKTSMLFQHKAIPAKLKQVICEVASSSSGPESQFPVHAIRWFQPPAPISGHSCRILEARKHGAWCPLDDSDAISLGTAMCVVRFQLHPLAGVQCKPCSKS